MNIKLNDFIREDGSMLIPKVFVPFVRMKKIPEKRTCKNCGWEFYPTHQRQSFCSPKPGNKRSTCENTYNQKIKRKRKKDKERFENGTLA